MKNYYEILEVSENASSEVIEKAYKILAKKYHPDLQPPEKLKWADEKFKELGEAYEVLSDEVSRQNYDIQLSEYKSKNNDYDNLLAHTQELENELNTLREESLNSNIQNNEIYQNELNNITNTINNAIRDAYSNAYNDAYNNSVESHSYNKTIKNYFKNLLTLLLTILAIFCISFVLWHIPFIRNYLIDVYNKNSAIRLLLSPFIKK